MNGESGEVTANRYCLSDEQLQELVRFFVWLHSGPAVQALVADTSDGPQTASEVTSLGFEDDLSELQLKALRRRCEDKNGRESSFDPMSEPKTPKFGGCPSFVEDFGLSDQQLEDLVLYYRSYQDAFTDASSACESDFCLSAEKLHKLRMTCEDDIMSFASIGSSMEKSETSNCKFCLSDAQLQTIACFNVWSRSRVSSTSYAAEPDNYLGLLCYQVEDIQQYYGWYQRRNKSLRARARSSWSFGEQLERQPVTQGNEPVALVVEQSIHCKVPNSVPQSQPKALPTKAIEVYHFPITDEQLQDLVCLFIWCAASPDGADSAASSDGAEMDGCDDDLDLPPKQLEQLKRKCAEAEAQGPHPQVHDAELTSLSEDVGIEKEQLQTLIRYCRWACTPEAKCFTLSVAQLQEVRTECEVQGLTCSWSSVHEGMSKVCNVSDERLQNLMRFYTWRCSTLGCTQLDDEFGPPDEDFEEIIRYLSWCEGRAMATGRTALSNHDTGCADKDAASSLMHELVAPEGVRPDTAEMLPIEVCSPCEEPVPEGVCTIEASSEYDTCSSFSFTVEDANQNEQPTESLAVHGNGDAEVPAQATRTSAVGSYREDSDDSAEVCTECDSACGNGASHSGSSEADVGSKQGSISAHHVARLAASLLKYSPAPDVQAISRACTLSLASPSSMPGYVGPSGVSRAQVEPDLADEAPARNFVYTSKCASAFPPHVSAHAFPPDVCLEAELLFTHPSPSVKAKTFCSAPHSADTWGWPSASWQRIKVASSSWLDQLTKSSCQRNGGVGLCLATEDPTKDLYVESTAYKRQIVEI